ncbi:pyruvate formate-lyase-activating protein [Dyella silvae]|uniref:pyruvate formate-lyase-activating protein n=1 Tax=Dyella silvae TaxID=2994424 RepID=UPI003CE50AEB
MSFHAPSTPASDALSHLAGHEGRRGATCPFAMTHQGRSTPAYPAQLSHGGGVTPPPLLWGRLHSVESGAAADGPGVRFVYFMSGCQFRCLYCHNPDTWRLSSGQQVTLEQAVDEVRPYVPFLRVAGGVTVSGGEPLLQAAFVGALLHRLHGEFNLHTALDTQGSLGRKVSDSWFDAVDLVLLDIKHADAAKHHAITRRPLAPTLEFAKRMVRLGKPLWIRYVLVPGLTDDPGDVARLGDLIAGLGPLVERVELLPFHQLGMHKWAELGRPYSLVNCPTPTPAQLRVDITYSAELNLRVVSGKVSQPVATLGAQARFNLWPEIGGARIEVIDVRCAGRILRAIPVALENTHVQSPLDTVRTVIQILHPHHARITPAHDAGAVAQRKADVGQRRRNVVQWEHQVPLLTDANRATDIGIGDIHVSLAQARNGLLLRKGASAIVAAKEVHLDAAATTPVVVQPGAGDIKPEARIPNVKATERAIVTIGLIGNSGRRGN